MVEKAVGDIVEQMYFHGGAEHQGQTHNRKRVLNSIAYGTKEF